MKKFLVGFAFLVLLAQLIFAEPYAANSACRVLDASTNLWRQVACPPGGASNGEATQELSSQESGYLKLRTLSEEPNDAWSNDEEGCLEHFTKRCDALGGKTLVRGRFCVCEAEMHWGTWKPVMWTFTRE